MIEQQRKEFKNLLLPRTSKERIDQDAKMIAAQFLVATSSLMQARNMKLKDLAEQLGVSKSYVTQIFRGNKLPNFKFIAKIQIALGVKFNVTSTSESIIATRAQEGVHVSP